MAASWQPQHWSIRTKSAALVASYIFALLAVYGFFTSTLIRREAALAQDRLQQTAALVAAEVDAYLEPGRQRLDTVSRLPGMTYGLRSMPDRSTEGRIPPWTSLHYLFFRSSVFTGGAFLADRTSKVLWAEPPGSRWSNQDLSGNPTLTDLFAGRAYVVSAGLPADALSDAPHVLMAVPVRNPDGAIDGVLGGVINLNAPALTRPLQAMSSADGRFLDVVDQQGKIIASNESSRVLQDSVEATGEDGPWMKSSVKLAQAPWQIVARQPRALALATVSRFQRELLLLGLGLLLVVLAVGTPIVNRSVRDIGTLTAAADTMARSDFSQPVRIRRRYDEIGKLAGSLEQMRKELEHSRLALERRLQEREELIGLKEVFLGNISHELRTPLNAIIGYNDILGDSELTTEGRELVAAVRAQSEHLHRLLTDLLTLSGLNVGRLDAEISPVRVQALLAHLKPLEQRRADSKGVKLVWECSPLLPTIETDPLRLEQILANLVTNAVKFTNHGQVTVRAALSHSGQQVAFEVSDTGIGIAATELPHIFDEFRQVNASSDSTQGGVGLGLALVKKLAALLQGEVTVSSELGRGSTFRVVLPLRFDQERTTAEVAA